VGSLWLAAGPLSGSHVCLFLRGAGLGSAERPRPLTVLDLGCGSGFLLELLAGRNQAGLDLLGIDISAAELKVARRALGTRAALVEAKGQAIPTADQGTDIILSHLVLMLMDDVEAVMAEAARVLRPGGTFAAVVGGATPASIAFTTYVRILERYRAQSPESVVRLGDRRFRSEGGIRDLLATRFRDISVEEIHVNRRLTPADMWAWFMGMYDLHQFREEERAAIEHEYVSAVAPHCDAAGALDFPQAFRHIQARSR
jgi:ubiquinone/menaquinone biosynthesis C-methylase UbiE